MAPPRTEVAGGLVCPRKDGIAGHVVQALRQNDQGGWRGGSAARTLPGLRRPLVTIID